MTTLIDPLDELISESLVAAAESAAAREARRRLAREPESADHAELKAMIAHYDETRLWDTLGNVALVTRNICSCGGSEEFFSGWMKEQKHRALANTRRLLAGRADGAFPEKIEYVTRQVRECANCIRGRFS